MSCGYFFILLLIYLHIMACLFFTVCLGTYKASTDRLKTLDAMELRFNESRPGVKCCKFDSLEPEVAECERAVMDFFGYDDPDKIDYEYGSRIHAWLPAYDNYDNTEQFWRHYELSLLDQS